MQEDFYPCVVVGAGVIGLAIARELALRGEDVLVLEAQSAIGTETSSRNSEVIHAGIYYPPGSLKAKLSVRGKRLLYAYCQSHHVPHRQCGKLIVASHAEQQDALSHIATQASANGVNDLEWLNEDEIREMEPQVRATKALFSPSTGIVDSHQLMLSLQGAAQRAGAVVVLKAPVVTGRILDNGLLLEVGGPEPMRLRVARLVNAAGLGAPQLAGSLQGFPSAHVPQAFYAKGNYFALRGKACFRHLVYPVPEPGGLGVHVTFDMAGEVRFGPDVEWVDEIDYRVEATRAERFYRAIRQYWPALPDGALVPAYAGIRSKISGPGEPNADFLIQDPSIHGIPNLINLFGIESPGLTASLAIAEEVASRLQP